MRWTQRFVFALGRLSDDDVGLHSKAFDWIEMIGE